MRIIIESLNENQPGVITVFGRTKIGSIKGLWKSKDAPLLNEEYDVELSLPMLLGSDVSVENVSLSPQAEVNSDETLYLRGTCEVIDEDDIYVVRFDANWIEMLEIENTDINVSDVISFTVNVNQVEIFPIV